MLPARWEAPVSAVAPPLAMTLPLPVADPAPQQREQPAQPLSEAWLPQVRELPEMGLESRLKRALAL